MAFIETSNKFEVSNTVKNAKNALNFLDGTIAEDEIIETLLEQWQLLAFFQEYRNCLTIKHCDISAWFIISFTVKISILS